jgi:hypothetical protein
MVLNSGGTGWLSEPPAFVAFVTGASGRLSFSTQSEQIYEDNVIITEANLSMAARVTSFTSNQAVLT